MKINLPPIIKCGLVPAGWCINLFGTLWVNRTDWINKYLINHELIHTAQQKEMLYLLFYLWYVAEWMVRLVQYRNRADAYINISFEREAYANGNDLNYLSRRRPYAWVRYLKYT